MKVSFFFEPKRAFFFRSLILFDRYFLFLGVVLLVVGGVVLVVVELISYSYSYSSSKTFLVSFNVYIVK